VVRPLNHDLVTEPIVQAVRISTQRRLQRQSKRGFNFTRAPDRAMLARVEEPQTLQDAMATDDNDQWREAWLSEVDWLAWNNT